MDVKNALSMLEAHVSKHSNNKYQNSPINNDHALKQPVFTVLTAEKYMTRYLAKNGEKQAQTEDLLKACHFLLFEIQNRFNQSSDQSQDLACDLESMCKQRSLYVSGPKCSCVGICKNDLYNKKEIKP